MNIFQNLSPSVSIYLVLVIVLAILGAINATLPMGTLNALTATGQLPTSKSTVALVTGLTMLIVYGGLGFIGLRLSGKLNIATLWDANITVVQRLVYPALAGCAVGVFFLVVDAMMQTMHPYGRLPHPPFPTSLVTSAVAGIGEEMIFRLFFIPLWTWVISSLILQGRAEGTTFWVVAIISALVFAVSHIPMVMNTFGIALVTDIPVALLAEILLLNSVVALASAFAFRRYGFLAAVSVHFWTDFVWHCLGGMLM